MKKFVPSEAKEQIALVRYLELVEKLEVYHFPPGIRGGKEGAILKMMGVKAGVPDLFVPKLKLWIELKRTQKGRLSKEQLEFKEKALTWGYEYIIAYGFADAKQQYLEKFK